FECASLQPPILADALHPTRNCCVATLDTCARKTLSEVIHQSEIMLRLLYAKLRSCSPDRDPAGPSPTGQQQSSRGASGGLPGCAGSPASWMWRLACPAETNRPGGVLRQAWRFPVVALRADDMSRITPWNRQARPLKRPFGRHTISINTWRRGAGTT